MKVLSVKIKKNLNHALTAYTAALYNSWLRLSIRREAASEQDAGGRRITEYY